MTTLQVGAIVFRHEPSDGAQGEIAQVSKAFFRRGGLQPARGVTARNGGNKTANTLYTAIQ